MCWSVIRHLLSCRSGDAVMGAMLSITGAAPAQIMCEVTPGDIQEHVRARLEAEQRDKEAKRREKLEAHLYTIVKLVRDADIADQIGAHRWFDLASPEKVRSRSDQIFM